VEGQKPNEFERGLRNKKQHIARTVKEPTIIHKPVGLHQLSISSSSKLKREPEI
jgi:hypothetical protein